MMTDANPPPSLKQVTIFTDGAAVPNPGAGGYGVVLRFGAHHKELSGGFRRTTNNRMELMAVIVGLEALKERCQATVHSDSQYIVEAVTSGAAFRWRGNGWKFKPLGAKLVKNPDLWERLLAAYEKHEEVARPCTWWKKLNNRSAEMSRPKGCFELRACPFEWPQGIDDAGPPLQTLFRPAILD